MAGRRRVEPVSALRRAKRPRTTFCVPHLAGFRPLGHTSRTSRWEDATMIDPKPGERAEGAGGSDLDATVSRDVSRCTGLQGHAVR